MNYPSDRQKTRLGPPLCGSDQHQAAWEVIQSYAAAGMLGPVPDWEGDVADAYADILGLEVAR
jgi:hypothetical protein